MPEPEDLFERPAGEPEENDNQLPHEAHEEQQPQSDEMPEVEGLITLPLEEIQAENAADGAMMQGEDGPAGEENAADLPPDPSDDGWDDESQSLMDKLKQAFANMLETLDMASVESSDSEQGKEQGSGNAEESASAGGPRPVGRGGPGDDVAVRRREHGGRGARPGGGRDGIRRQHQRRGQHRGTEQWRERLGCGDE